MSIGSRIKKRRLELNMSVEDLAEKIGKSQPTIYRYEKEEVENLPPSIMNTLTSALETTPAFLLGVTEIPTKVMTRKAPLYGAISAGTPIEMIEAIDYLDIPDSLASRYPNAFYLQVNGDSMNKLIPPNSFALIDPCPEVANGEIAAVAVNNCEATLKRFFKLTSSIVLEPESFNPEHTTQHYDCNNSDCENIRVLGKLLWYMPPMNLTF